VPTVLQKPCVPNGASGMYIHQNIYPIWFCLSLVELSLARYLRDIHGWNGGTVFFEPEILCGTG